MLSRADLTAHKGARGRTRIIVTDARSSRSHKLLRPGTTGPGTIRVSTLPYPGTVTMQIKFVTNLSF